MKFLSFWTTKFNVESAKKIYYQVIKKFKIKDDKYKLKRQKILLKQARNQIYREIIQGRIRVKVCFHMDDKFAVEFVSKELQKLGFYTNEVAYDKFSRTPYSFIVSGWGEN